jgi:hypothetical protein
MLTPNKQAMQATLRAVMLTMGIHKIGGGATNGFVELEEHSADAEYIVGRLGHVIINENVNDVLLMKIHVLGSTKEYRILAELMQKQFDSFRTVDWPLMLKDLNNGDVLSDPHAAFLKRPSMSKDGQNHDKTFELILPNGKRNQKFGLFNLF